MNKYLEEALGFIIASAIFFIIITNSAYPIIAFLIRIVLFLVGCILALASAGSFLRYINRNKNTSEIEKENSNKE